jgi:ParB family chromosome partitioning protein
LKLDPIIQTGIRDGFISMVMDAIINIEEVQTDIYQKIVSQNLSVRDTETLVKLPRKFKT